MHHTVIEAYRRLLFLTVLEAAKTVACTSVRPEGVSERAWHRWESGEGVMPDEVTVNLLALIRRRQREIDSIAAQIAGGTEPILTAPKKGADVLEYKIKLSVFAEAMAMGCKEAE